MSGGNDLVCTLAGSLLPICGWQPAGACFVQSGQFSRSLFDPRDRSLQQAHAFGRVYDCSNNAIAPFNAFYYAGF